MKLSKLQGFVRAPRLQEIMWGSTYKEDLEATQRGVARALPRDLLIRNLFAASHGGELLRAVLSDCGPSRGLEKTWIKFLERICAYSSSEGSRHGLTGDQIATILSFSYSQARQIKSLFRDQPFHSCLSAVSASCFSIEFYMSRRHSIFDLSWTLPQMRDVREGLQANRFELARVIQKRIDDELGADPEFRSLTPKESRSSETPTAPSGYDGAYDKNRIGSGIPGLRLNWSDVVLPNQRYFAGGCPYTIEGVSAVLEAFTNQGGRVMVSLYQLGPETEGRINAFWQPEVLSRLRLSPGLRIGHRGFKVLDEIPVQEGGTRCPQIVERIFQVTRDREVFEVKHFHFDGWADRNDVPSLELFDLLLQQVLAQESCSDAPLAINCKIGVGRTGVFLVSHYLLKEIISLLECGTPVEDIRPDVFGTISMLRKQRKNMLFGPQSLHTVFEYFEYTFERIRRLGVEKFLEEYRPSVKT